MLTAFLVFAAILFPFGAMAQGSVVRAPGTVVIVVQQDLFDMRTLADRLLEHATRQNVIVTDARANSVFLGRRSDYGPIDLASARIQALAAGGGHQPRTADALIVTAAYDLRKLVVDEYDKYYRHARATLDMDRHGADVRTIDYVFLLMHPLRLSDDEELSQPVCTEAASEDFIRLIEGKLSDIIAGPTGKDGVLPTSRLVKVFIERSMEREIPRAGLDAMVAMLGIVRPGGEAAKVELFDARRNSACPGATTSIVMPAPPEGGACDRANAPPTVSKAVDIFECPPAQTVAPVVAPRPPAPIVAPAPLPSPAPQAGNPGSPGTVAAVVVPAPANPPGSGFPQRPAPVLPPPPPPPPVVSAPPSSSTDAEQPLRIELAFDSDQQERVTAAVAISAVAEGPVDWRVIHMTPANSAAEPGGAEITAALAEKPFSHPRGARFARGEHRFFIALVPNASCRSGTVVSADVLVSGTKAPGAVARRTRHVLAVGNCNRPVILPVLSFVE